MRLSEGDSRGEGVSDSTKRFADPHGRAPRSARHQAQGLPEQVRALLPLAYEPRDEARGARREGFNCPSRLSFSLLLALCILPAPFPSSPRALEYHLALLHLWAERHGIGVLLGLTHVLEAWVRLAYVRICCRA